MGVPESLLADAARALSREFGTAVRLHGPETLESESTVIRARASATHAAVPDSVIIKHVTDTTFDQPDHEGAPQRFLNEWACLSFLGEIGARVGPTVLAADRDGGFLVLDDLGDLPSLQSILFDADGGEARRGLAELGRLMGEMQAATQNMEARFTGSQRALGTGSPRCDSTIDQRGRSELFHGCLEAFGVSAERGFWERVVEIESAIHDGSPFWSLIHADAGPQNVLVSKGRSALIDFEYAVYRNGLCDVVGARLGFPQTTHARYVAAADARLVEDSYRAGVAESIPEAEDTAVFGEALTAAAAHWSLNRWAALWRTLGQDARPTRNHDLERSASTMLVLDGFVGLARESGFFVEVAVTIERLVSAIRGQLPDFGLPSGYPALRNAPHPDQG